MIDIQHLSKSFSSKIGATIGALNQLNTQFEDGAITAILGLNGAGKSTLMRIIYGLFRHNQIRPGAPWAV